MQTKIELPLDKKYTLTIREAAVYFNIGEKGSAGLPKTILAR